MNNDLKIETINSLYEVFSNYLLKGNMDKCTCGCIPDDKAQKIYSKPLRELESEDLVFYSGKAMTTWGDLNDYKHFLPRLFEIYSLDRFNGLIDLDSIINKLEYGEWQEWPDSEKKVIIDFVLSDWIDFANHNDSEIYFLDLCRYSKFLDLEMILNNWNYLTERIALKNLIGLLYNNINQILNKKKPVFINEKDSSKSLIKVILDQKFVDLLEIEFFEMESRDPEYAGKISAVLQIIEIEIKTAGNTESI